ncbi:tigger transposable element-derived protein 1 [Trichonephila clavipes]|nr:tigger transposable element-derived protein 1 [Trichonephila clavipes]
MKQSEPSTSQAGKEFSASKGWLTGFLKRNALHNIKITGESATADEGAAKIFPEELAKIIEDGGYSADQVFNADETGLYWKKLPNRTYIAKDEKSASRHKARRATQNENEVCENPWPLPQISVAETVSSDDEGDLEPLRKRCKPLSDSDND